MREIVCVEPNNSLHTELRKNMDQNCKIIDCAISNKEGLVDYYVHPDSSMNGIVPVNTEDFDREFKYYPASNIKKVKIKTRKLDSSLSHMIDDNSTDILLKLDTQGNELDVLLSGSRLLELVSVCVVEYMYWSGYKKEHDLIDLLKLMRNAGFGYCGPCSTEFRDNGRIAYSDLLFIK